MSLPVINQNLFCRPTQNGNFEIEFNGLVSKKG
jgi:hypothetical protein